MTIPPPGTPGDGPVVVGIHPGLPDDVARRAGQLAVRLGVGVVCVWVDPARALVHEGGRDEIVSIDPDGSDSASTDEAALRSQVTKELAELDVPWTIEVTAGDLADGLVAAANAHDATFIVVGTHRPGLGRWAETVVGHALGGHLAHSQHRPVVVLPRLHHDKRGTSETSETNSSTAGDA